MDTTPQERLAELLEQTRGINLSKNDKDNGSAIFQLILINNDLSIQIDGTWSSIAHMLFNAAHQYPALREVVKNVASEL